jgi:L-glyceraldehyde 3-phosphate reductase
LLADRYLQGIPRDPRMAKEKFLRPDMLTPELLAQLRAWDAEARAEGRTLAANALRWILRQEGVTSVLVGASSTAQLETNLKAI